MYNTMMPAKKLFLIESFNINVLKSTLWSRYGSVEVDIQQTFNFLSLWRESTRAQVREGQREGREADSPQNVKPIAGFDHKTLRS